MQEQTAPSLLPDGLGLTPAKRRLYEAALRLFGEHGYHAVSIRDLASALGQQPSALYFHVDSKERLLFDLALIGHRMHRDALRAAAAAAGEDPTAQLLAVFQAHLRVHLDHPAIARLTNRELGALAPDHLAEVLVVRQESEDVFVRVLERGMREGAFPVTDAFLVGKALGALGIRLPEWWAPDGPRSRQEVLDQYSAYATALVRAGRADRPDCAAQTGA